MTDLTEVLTAPSIDDLIPILDRYLSRLEQRPSPNTADECIRLLAQVYDHASMREQMELFREQCQSHALHQFVLEDPFSRRAFEKPRGYAGDAVMLDYIYRPAALNLSEVGRAFHEATTGVSSAQSIVWRRDHLASEIVKVMERNSSPRILSVASGHLRELDIVRKMITSRSVEIIALDQDKASLEEAIRSYPDFCIRPVNQSISYLFKNDETSAPFDLIYSAGLFDYLPEKTAVALLQKLVDRLQPRGRVVIGNYTPDNYGRGFMEGMMDWRLIYRAEDDLIRIAKSGAGDRDFRTYRDAPGNVAYIEISQHWN